MMNKVLMLSALLLSSTGFADIVENSGLPEATANLPVSPEFLDFLVASFNGAKGATVFGAAAITIQVIIKALDQPFSNYFFGKRSGLNKLLIISGLTFAVTPIGLIAGAGLSVSAALLHTSTLASFMVFLNQLYKQASEAKAQKDLAKTIDSLPK